MLRILGTHLKDIWWDIQLPEAETRHRAQFEFEGKAQLWRHVTRVVILAVGKQQNSTEQDRLRTTQKYSRKDRKQRRQQEGATYKSSTVVPQCFFLVLFPFFPNSLYVALIVALRSFKPLSDNEKNKQTSVELQALSWRGQRVRQIRVSSYTSETNK